MKVLFKFNILLSIGVIFWSCTKTSNYGKNVVYGEALGTTYAITYISKEQVDLQPSIDSLFNVVNKSMSTYIPDSDISKINNGDTTIIVDKMFEEVFATSKKVFEATNGYFDPTIGILVDAWGFGPGEQVPLDSVKVDSLLRYVGFNKVNLTSENRIKKQNSSIRFDFNAVAKGYAIDRLGVLLSNKGYQNYLVEVGGEILAKGKNSLTDKPWTVGVDDPINIEDRGRAAIVQLQDKALASSGNYRKYRVDSITGEKYVHTINPKTGFTKNSSLLAATVVADNCAMADAFATSFMAMGIEKAIEYLNTQSDLDAFLIYVAKDGTIQNFKTKGFKSIEIN